MLMDTWLKSKRQILALGALGLMSHAALSSEAKTKPEAELLTVSASRAEIAIADPRIETDTDAVIDAINRRIEEDLVRSLEAIGNARIQLAVSEFPTRG
jgi:hypothetical protein